jgi:hypothetical protein
MTPLIVQRPAVFTMTIPPAGGTGQGTDVDLCDYVRRVVIDTTADEVDASTLCTARTVLGTPRYSCTLALAWSFAAYAALETHVGKTVKFHLEPSTDDKKAIEWDGSYAFVPFGTYEPGKLVEVDMPVAVDGAPEVVTVTP